MSSFFFAAFFTLISLASHFDLHFQPDGQTGRYHADHF
jgi:hypothetical protein